MKQLDKLTQHFGSHKAAGAALGMKQDNYRYLREGRFPLRQPYKMLLAYFENDPEQFEEVLAAVREGRKPRFGVERIMAKALTSQGQDTPTSQE